LVGQSGSGKSTIGSVLAEKLHIKFKDLDSYIEEKEKLTIAKIFDKKGEIYFRKKEGDYLVELLSFKEDCVISTGGGTPCYGDNMKNIERKSISFYVNASIATIFERLKNETVQRPMVATIAKDNLKEFIAKHLFERIFFYKKAQHTISVNNKSVAAIVKEIENLL